MCRSSSLISYYSGATMLSSPFTGSTKASECRLRLDIENWRIWCFSWRYLVNRCKRKSFLGCCFWRKKRDWKELKSNSPFPLFSKQLRTASTNWTSPGGFPGSLDNSRILLQTLSFSSTKTPQESPELSTNFSHNYWN